MLTLMVLEGKKGTSLRPYFTEAAARLWIWRSGVRAPASTPLLHKGLRNQAHESLLCVGTQSGHTCP